MPLIMLRPYILAEQIYAIYNSLRFNSNDSAYLNRTFALGNRKTWTWSGWVKQGGLGSTNATASQGLFGVNPNGVAASTQAAYIGLNNTTTTSQNDGGFTVWSRNNSAVQMSLTSNQLFRDVAGWYHVVVAMDTTQAIPSNRTKVWINGEQITSWATASFPAQNDDLGWNLNTIHTIGHMPLSANWARYLQGYMTDVTFVDGQSLGPDNFGVTDFATGQWKPIPYAGTYGTTGFYLPFNEASSLTTLGYDKSGANNLVPYSKIDNTNWTVHTTDGTPNFGTSPTGVPSVTYRTTSASPARYATCNGITPGRVYTYSVYVKCGANDPIQLYADYFGQIPAPIVTWDTPQSAYVKTAAVSGAGITSLGNGWYRAWMSFSVSTTGVNVLINPNTANSQEWWGAQLNPGNVPGEYLGTAGTPVAEKNWTLNNFSVVAGANSDWFEDSPTNNFCTLNTVAHGVSAAINGALRVNVTSGSGVGTFGLSSGKWYWEYQPTALGSQDITVGICQGSTFEPTLVGGYAWGIRLGRKWTNSVMTTGFATAVANDIISCAFDADAGTLTIYKNNVSVMSFTGIPDGTYFPCSSVGGTAGTNAIWYNFGQRAFDYTPPTGFNSLCTANLPDPVIANPNEYFDVKLHTGTGAAGQVVSGLNFSPDFVWIKNRSAVAGHVVFDTSRGAQWWLSTNQTVASANDNTTLTAFNANGFTVGSNIANGGNGSTYVDWCWKKGSLPGFDVVTWTGDGTANKPIAHNLGVVPKLCITKQASAVGNWPCRTLADGTHKLLTLHTTNAAAASVVTPPTSTTFYVSGTTDNSSGVSCVGYIFAEVPGFSKISTYTGNGLADGAFVYCGFTPKYIMIKRMDAAATDWMIFDTLRSPTNVSTLIVSANVSDAEVVGTTRAIDFVSNGVKLRGTAGGVNATGGTYFFMAFAELPFKYSNAR